MSHQGTWYLMSAFALTEKRRAPITEVGVHWTDSTVYVVKSASGKKLFAVSCGADGTTQVGDTARFVKDTGNGHQFPKYEDSHLTIENVVSFKSGAVASSINQIGLDEKRAIHVFK